MNFARSILIAMTAIAAFTSVPTGRAQAAGFDGTWSVLVITDQGTCDRAYRYPVRISHGKVGHTDPTSSFNIGGRVASSGAVSVFVSRGNQRADGVGRLVRVRRRRQMEVGQRRMFRPLDGRTPWLRPNAKFLTD